MCIRDRAIVNHQATVTGCDSYLRLIDLETGKQSQQLPLGDYIVASPAILGDLVFVGTYSGRFFCADLKTAQTVWKYENTKSQFPIFASAAVTDTTVIMASKDKNVYAFDPMTGHEQWRISTKSRIEASPVIANNIVLFATTAGNLYAIDIENGKQNWFFEIGFPIVAGPAIAAERLVIGDTNGTVYCFGSPSVGAGKSEK